MSQPGKDAPGAVARPPLIFLGSILVGSILHFSWPVRLVPNPLAVPLGGSFVAVSVILFALAVRELRQARTGIRTNQPTTAIVARGPYRFSRNPIYVSFALLQLGVAIWVNSAWILGTLVPTLGIIRYGVIAREEAYLERKFGQEYRQYKGRVRRWL